MTAIQIGRLLSANTRQFLVGCRVTQSEIPPLGALVRVNPQPDYAIYGLVYDLYIADDGLVRQLATVEEMDESVIADHRLHRSVPLEIHVLAVGYQKDGRIYHLLPPQPPLGLELMWMCSVDEVVQFTSLGRFGYLRHILREQDVAVEEVLAAHLQFADRAHRQRGDANWSSKAVQEMIVLLRDDYGMLMRVLQSVADTQIIPLTG
ncbi:MAG: hypothetical protein ACPL4H_10885 [Anaerolineales bacterium]